MQTPACAQPEIYSYRLSDDALLLLKETRDQLFFYATLANPTTLEEESLPLELKRSALGESYETLALKLDDVIKAIVRWDRESTVAH
jgi:hypothetical protein